MAQGMCPGPTCAHSSLDAGRFPPLWVIAKKAVPDQRSPELEGLCSVQAGPVGGGPVALIAEQKSRGAPREWNLPLPAPCPSVTCFLKNNLRMACSEHPTGRALTGM